MDLFERQPEDVGMRSDSISRALDLIRARSTAAQICVLRDGKVVLDRSFECAPGSLFWIFSASKPFMTMLVFILAEKGQLRLDDPVAKYWPEFGRNGKSAITIRDVLQHRSGVPVAGSVLGDAICMTNWNRSVRRIEHARPSKQASGGPVYQILTYGFILGELAHRVTGIELPKLLAAEILGPLGMKDTFLGLPFKEWNRHVPVQIRPISRALRLPGRLVQMALNRRATRSAVVPAAGISTTARDLAVFYQMLLQEGECNGVRLLQPAGIRQATAPSSPCQWDRYARAPLRWAHGFQLGGPRPDPAFASAMGRLSTERTFGHNGSNCCIGWADPDRKLVFVYLTNLLTSIEKNGQHMADVSDAIHSACSPIPDSL
jgi:CubicO group peptidase (beta-lactamase class C family)